jgi:hypothetical protein
MESMQKQAQASAKTDPMQEIAKLGDLSSKNTNRAIS